MSKAIPPTDQAQYKVPAAVKAALLDGEPDLIDPDLIEAGEHLPKDYRELLRLLRDLLTEKLALAEDNAVLVEEIESHADSQANIFRLARKIRDLADPDCTLEEEARAEEDRLHDERWPKDAKASADAFSTLLDDDLDLYKDDDEESAGTPFQYLGL